MSEQAKCKDSKTQKAMELLAREIDKQTNFAHKDAKSTLESNVDTILKDDKGNL